MKPKLVEFTFLGKNDDKKKKAALTSKCCVCGAAAAEHVHYGKSKLNIKLLEI